MVDKAARATSGIAKSEEDLQHFQLEYSSYQSDPWVGGKLLASGSRMIALTEGTQTMTLMDQHLKAQLRVEVKPRD